MTGPDGDVATPALEAEPDLYGSLDGQVALVTGANRGIGEEIARRLVDLGATVYAGSRARDRTVPDGCRHVLLDVTQEGDVESVLEGIEADSGRLDVLVNNAGVLLGGDDDLMGEPTPAIDRTLATNLRGPILLCKYALPLLLEQPGGRVVNVSSAMGRLSRSHDATAASYRLSKVGVNGLTVYLDEAYGDRGLLANAVTPGWVRTRLGGEDADRSVEAGAETPVWLTRFRPGSPAGLFWRDREPRPW